MFYEEIDGEKIMLCRRLFCGMLKSMGDTRNLFIPDIAILCNEDINGKEIAYCLKCADACFWGVVKFMGVLVAPRVMMQRGCLAFVQVLTKLNTRVCHI